MASVRFEVLERHSMWHPLSDWLINDYLLSSFHSPWKPLNWNAVPNYPLVIVVILPNRMWASYPDGLSGAGRKVGWAKEEPTLDPEGSTWLSKRKVVPAIGCRIVTKHGVRALLTHGACHKHGKIPGKNLGAINSTCYWVKWLNLHLLLVSHPSDCSVASHDLKA